MHNERYLNALRLVYGNERTINDYLRSADEIVELKDGIIVIKKEDIKTSFCFGHGYCGISTKEEEDRAYKLKKKAATESSYFITKNMEKYADIAEIINKDKKVFICDRYVANSEIKTYSIFDPYEIEIDRYCTYRSMSQNAGFRELTIEERQGIYNALLRSKAKFEKRLHTYLKRYGLSKVRTWTYLSD